MKHIIYICLLFPFLGYSQPITFDKLYTNGHIGYAVIPNSQGYVVAGNSDITNDYWLFQTDFYGNKMWENHYGRQYGVYDNTNMTNTVMSKDGGYFLAGYSFSVPDTNYWQSGIYHGYVVKTDSLGNMLWDRLMISTYDSSRTSRFNNVAATSDGGCLLTGYIFLAYSDTVAYTDIGFYVVKLNENGDVEWEKIYGAVSGLGIYSIAFQTTNQHYLVGGRNALNNSSSGFVMALDIYGDSLWSLTNPTINVTNDTLYEFRTIVQLADGSIMLGGSASFLKINEIGNVLWSKNLWGIMKIISASDGNYLSRSLTKLCQIDSNGNEVWVKDVGTEIRAFAKTDDGGFVILTNQGATAVRLLKTDCEGNIINPITCTTEISQNQVLKEVFMHPNPANDRIEINFPQNGAYEIIISDIQGKMLTSKIVESRDNADLNISFLSKGIYFVHVKELNTNISAQIKLIKE